jgi:two-component system response regulator HydG
MVEVLETHSGKKALNILETFVPDLVMTDFRLEDMDGKALLIKIKEKYPRVPVIIITGYSDIKTAVEVMKLGAYDYVTKPLFPDEILVTIRKALEGDHAVPAQGLLRATRLLRPRLKIADHNGGKGNPWLR